MFIKDIILWLSGLQVAEGHSLKIQYNYKYRHTYGYFG